jgi:nicotinate phosphoribosyltransferase
MSEDLLTLVDHGGVGQALIQPVMRGGQRIGAPPTLAEARDRAANEIGRLPGHLRRLETSPSYPVIVSRELRALADEVDRMLAAVSQN